VRLCPMRKRKIDWGGTKRYSRTSVPVYLSIGFGFGITGDWIYRKYVQYLYL
jgi:hypothetical protein